MIEMPAHFEMPINEAGDGPEMDPDKVVAVICWSCLPDEEWPCKAIQEARDEVHEG